MHGRVRSSLRLRFLLVLALVVLPFAALEAFEVWDERAQARQSARSTSEAFLEDMLLEQRNRIDGAHVLLRALAESPTVREWDGPCDEFVARISHGAPRYANIGVANAEGDVVCSAVPLTSPVNIADRAYFRRAVERLDFAVGDYQIGRVTGVASLNMGLPIHNGEDLVGVLFVALDLEWLSSQIPLASLVPGAAVVMSDRNGLILARQPSPELYVGQVMMGNQSLVDEIVARRQGNIEATGLDGVRRYYSFDVVQPGPGAGEVFVAVGTPISGLYARADEGFVLSFAVLAGVLLVGGLAGWMVAESVVLRPVATIARVAQRMRSGDLSARTGLAESHSELGALGQRFDEMAEAVQRLDQAKVNLIQTAAHELGTPLTSLRLSLATLRARNDLSTEQRRVTDNLDRNVERLVRIAGMVTYAARLQTGSVRLDLEPMDLGPLLRDRVAALEPLAMAKDIRVTAAVGPMPVLVDAAWMARVLDQVLDNSVKYTPAGGNVRVEASAQGREAVVAVRDSGIGIAAERIAGLFEPFNPLYDEMRTDSGLGLGLYVARELLERLGGTIEAESPGPGRGTTFTLRIPLHAGH